MSGFLIDIYKWYNINKRDLPWRQTNDPYKIWLSEIILQQTRVVQGLNYYQNFVERFSTVEKLALADEDEVLKMWQGLGYYSRARNMHQTAKYIHSELSDRFPSEYNDILKLKGVGSYTAAAIASIAFNLPYPVVDGNVSRFISRFFGVTSPFNSAKGKKKISHIATQLITEKNPGIHNQAMMEFGALQCTPKSPRCEVCPVLKQCYAASNRLVDKLPLKTNKKVQKERFFYYYLIEYGETLLLEKRTKSDIWKNLYQFPLHETPKRLTEEELLQEEIPFLKDCKFTVKSVLAEKKHILSHQVIFARIINIVSDDLSDFPEDFIKINRSEITKFAVSRLLENLISELEIY